MHDTWVTESTLKYPKEMFKNTVKHGAAVQQSCWIFYKKCIQNLYELELVHKSLNTKKQKTNKNTAKTLKQLKYKKNSLTNPVIIN